MKKRIIALILTVCISAVSLSSCLLLDPSLLPEIGSTQSGGDTTINVEGGDTYENINITSTHDKNLLAASKAVLSSVSIVTTFNEYDAFKGKIVKNAYAGSGVIYKLDKERGDAYVITNYHVVYSAKSVDTDGISDDIKLYLYGLERVTADGKSYAMEASYVGGSMYYDIAVLKITASEVLMASEARAADIADSDAVSLFDTAIAVGNPSGEGLSATVGTINVDSQEITLLFETKSATHEVKMRVMRTDAAVNGGNSGGGLYNDRGEMIGVVNSKKGSSGEGGTASVDNIGYAIPSNVAVAIADNAIYYSDGTVKRCLLGITVSVKEYSTKYDTETGRIEKLEEVVITELTNSSPAKGHLFSGDIINSITVGGKKQTVTRMHQVVDSMLAARVGGEVTLNVTRDDKTLDVLLPITEEMLTVY